MLAWQQEQSRLNREYDEGAARWLDQLAQSSGETVGSAVVLLITAVSGRTEPAALPWLGHQPDSGGSSRGPPRRRVHDRSGRGPRRRPRVGQVGGRLGGAAHPVDDGRHGTAAGRGRGRAWAAPVGRGAQLPVPARPNGAAGSAARAPGGPGHRCGGHLDGDPGRRLGGRGAADPRELDEPRAGRAVAEAPGGRQGEQAIGEVARDRARARQEPGGQPTGQSHGACPSAGRTGREGGVRLPLSALCGRRAQRGPGSRCDLDDRSGRPGVGRPHAGRRGERRQHDGSRWPADQRGVRGAGPGCHPGCGRCAAAPPGRDDAQRDAHPNLDGAGACRKEGRPHAEPAGRALGADRRPGRQRGERHQLRRAGGPGRARRAAPRPDRVGKRGRLVIPSTRCCRPARDRPGPPRGQGPQPARRGRAPPGGEPAVRRPHLGPVRVEPLLPRSPGHRPGVATGALDLHLRRRIDHRPADRSEHRRHARWPKARARRGFRPALASGDRQHP